MKTKVLTQLLGMMAIFLTIIACGPTQDVTLSAKEVEEWTNAQQFEVQATWAYPLSGTVTQILSSPQFNIPGSTGSRINLIGMTSYLKIKGDSVEANLPYFGERQMGGGYNSTNNGIKFEGLDRNLKIEKNERKNAQVISFDVDGEATENYQVYVMLFANKNSRIAINSSQRQSIRYDGTVSKLEQEEEIQ